MCCKDKKITILALDDDPKDLILLERHLGMIDKPSIELIKSESWELAQTQLQKKIDVIIIDYRIEPITGIDIVKSLRRMENNCPIIVLTGQGNEKIATEIMQAGANDYLVKDEITPDILHRSITNALDKVQLQEGKKLLELELYQAQKMESLGILAGGIAHDFNNMLTGIMGFIDLAMLQTKEKTVRKSLESAINISQQMSELVQQLLSFSRKNSEERTFNFNQLLKEMENILTHTISKDITLSISTPKETINIKGKPSLFNQAIMNVCLNALDAMPHGGELTINCKTLLIDDKLLIQYPSLEKGEHLLVQIKDTGFGIKTSELPSLFEPFFTMKKIDPKKGTGLGLAIAWQNIKRYKGTITVESEINRGSTFCIYIPIFSENPKKTTKKITRKETILIVDDEEYILELVGISLKQLQYNVYTASNGKEALKLYKDIMDTIDMVILDIVMPDMNGEECFQKMRELNPKVKVLFISGYDMKKKKRILWILEQKEHSKSLFI